MKKCSKCNREKDLNGFHRNYLASDGRSSECKACESERKKEYYVKNSDHIRSRNKQWHEANRDQAIAVQKLWRANNIEKDKNNKKAYREKNKDRINAANQRYKERNKEKLSQYSIDYRLSNPERFMLNNARTRAKKAKVPFNLSMADIVIPERCPVLGIPLKPATTKTMQIGTSPSLDRLIPSLGYVRGNIAIISHRANAIKRDGTLEELERIVKWMKFRGAV